MNTPVKAKSRPNRVTLAVVAVALATCSALALAGEGK